MFGKMRNDSVSYIRKNESVSSKYIFLFSKFDTNLNK